MQVIITLKNSDEPVRLENIHIYGTVAAQDFLSFFQRAEEFDEEKPLATHGFHFQRAEVLGFETMSDEIDIAYATKRQEAEEQVEWEIQAESLQQTDNDSPSM